MIDPMRHLILNFAALGLTILTTPPPPNPQAFDKTYMQITVNACNCATAPGCEKSGTDNCRTIVSAPNPEP